MLQNKIDNNNNVHNVNNDDNDVENRIDTDNTENNIDDNNVNNNDNNADNNIDDDNTENNVNANNADNNINNNIDINNDKIQKFIKETKFLEGGSINTNDILPCEKGNILKWYQEWNKLQNNNDNIEIAKKIKQLHLKILNNHKFVRKQRMSEMRYKSHSFLCVKYTLNTSAFMKWTRRNSEGRKYRSKAGGFSDDGLYTVSTILQRCVPRGFHVIYVTALDVSDNYVNASNDDTNEIVEQQKSLTAEGKDNENEDYDENDDDVVGNGCDFTIMMR